MAVLFLITEGLADKEIASILDVTPYTINKHVGAILSKMQVRSRTAAAVRATREHVFPDDTYEMPRPMSSTGTSDRVAWLA